MREDEYAGLALIGLLAGSDEPVREKVAHSRETVEAAFAIAFDMRREYEESGLAEELEQPSAGGEERLAAREAHLRAFLDFYDASDEPNPLVFFEIMHERAAAIRKDLGEKQTNGEVG